jgi:hypothetical protein
MQDRFVQALRYKLQKRVRRLNSADEEQFPYLLRVFFKFFENSPVLAGVRDELLARNDPHDFESAWERIIKGEALYGETEEASATLGFLVLKRFAESPPDANTPKTILALGNAYGATGKVADYLDAMRTVFLEPFYEYVDEHIDDQQAILYFLRRYKHRCEWFRADRLRQPVEADTQKGERLLAFDLYEYLHEQGIEFHIEPHSASGIADFVADQVGDDRVVADAKVFWPEKGKGKPYLLSGFHQAYTYACDYNEPCAYLVIFKMCKENVNFLVPAIQTMFPCLSLNNKTIFFIIVDICEHGVPASKRGPLKSVDISAMELIQSVEGVSTVATHQAGEKPVTTTPPA